MILVTINKCFVCVGEQMDATQFNMTSDRYTVKCLSQYRDSDCTSIRVL